MTTYQQPRYSRRPEDDGDREVSSSLSASILFILALAGVIVCAVLLSLPVQGQTVGPWRVIGLAEMTVGDMTYRWDSYQFVRVVVPDSPRMLCTLRTPELNIVRCFSFPAICDNGVAIVPVFRDVVPQVVEIQACGEGDYPASCPVIVPAVKIDTLPTWLYDTSTKRRAVR